MRTIEFKLSMTILGLFICAGSVAQTADVTVTIKGIKEVKGKIMVVAGNASEPQKMIRAMVEVTDTVNVVCSLKNVPIGKTTISVFQDLNEDMKLNEDENHIPTEPCNKKDNVTVKDGENKIELKLLNIKEMLGK